jgi:hypothetical protein
MKKIYFLFIFILFVFLFLLFNLRFTLWPEMVAWPYLITKGWLPYRDIAIAHNPLLLGDLHLFFKAFGVGVFQIKVFTWILFIISQFLVFIFAKEFWNKKAAIFSVIFYFLLFVFYEGNGLWFDLYMGIFAFVSFYFIRKGNWLWAGVFFGLAFLSKQTAAWFLIPILIDVIVRLPLKEAPFKLLFGVSFIFALFLIFLWHLGILDDWWRWALNFGIFVLPKSQGQIQLPSLKLIFLGYFPFLIFLIYFLASKGKKINHKSYFLFLFVWGLVGSFGSYPRFELFHFQPSIYYLAIAFGVVFSEFFKFKLRFQYLFFFFFFGNFFFFKEVFVRDLAKETRFYEDNVKEVSNFVKSKTNPGDYILVLNWWDSLYAFTQTIPATKPLVPQLAWYQEIRGVQEKEVEDLSQNRPKLIIKSPYTKKGLSSYMPLKLYDYIIKNYKTDATIGGIEILTPR